MNIPHQHHSVPRLAHHPLVLAQAWVALQFDAAIDMACDALQDARHSNAQTAAGKAWRSASVVQALQHTLDLRRGGELARQLFELFDYVQRRLRTANDAEDAYREAIGLLSEVRQAWQSEPDLVPTRQSRAHAQLH